MARDESTATTDADGDCERCNGTGQVMVGEKQVHVDETDTLVYRPAYDRCPACGGDD